MLTGCLVEVLDIFGHRRGGNGFPCLFNHQRLTTFLDTHLLGEHVHDDKQHDRSQHGIVLNLVQLKDDELLIEEGGLHIAVEGFLIFAALVEGGEDGCIVVDVELRGVEVHLFHQLGDALEGELIEGVEHELFDT